MKGIAVFGGSFLPPGNHHIAVVEAMQKLKFIDDIVIVPCGPRPDKTEPGTEISLTTSERGELCELAFQGLAKTRCDLFDLNSPTFTRTWDLIQRYESLGEVWIVIGADLLGQIQSSWYRGPELWQSGRFLVLTREGFSQKNLPPKHVLIPLAHPGSSSLLRERLSRKESITGLVPPAVAEWFARR